MNLNAAVWDSQSGNGIPSASVVIVDPTNKPVGGGVAADVTGKFAISSPLLDQGYNLQITSSGYQGVIVAPYMLQEDGGVTLERGGDLVPVVITAKKRINPMWIAAGLGLLALVLYASSRKSGKVSGMSQKDWVDIAVKVGISAGLFFLVLVPILKKLGLWGGAPPQADANKKAVDDSLKAVIQQGGTSGTQTKTEAEYTAMANQIYNLGGADPVDQVSIRNIVIQVNTLADMLSLVSAFGTRKVGGAFISLCGFFGYNCPEMDLPTFLRNVAPDQLSTINQYLSATHINYSI